MAREFGASTATVSYEEEAMQAVEVAEDAKDLLKRAPVVTIMGHVDHGKTSLLDAIREANVAGREAGGITQHIGAYQVDMNGRKIVFIDTPGHEAFTRMRARGAKVTDIVVLVVAADDGVMPQTLEAIDHARAAESADHRGDQQDRQARRAARTHQTAAWPTAACWRRIGAATPSWCRSPPKPMTNLDLLLEMILLVADLQDLKANPSRPAMGTVIEAQLDRGRGPVATVLVRNGTLHVGDFFICGSVFGKVRAMQNDRGAQIRKAEPSTPVEVLGLESLPEAGDDFQVVTDTAKAKQIVNFRDQKAREAALAKSSRLTLEQLHKQMQAGEVKELPIIIKTDVGGSAEVLTETLQKLSNDKVKVRVIHSGVGAINESDVLLASASNAIIIGFNVRPERKAESHRRAGEGGYPPAHDHLQPDRRDQARHDRPARAGVQGSLQGQGRSARDVPHQQGGQRGRLPGHRRLDHAASRKSGCCATTWWSTPARSARCGVSKTTSARSRPARSAALRSKTTRT